MKKLLVGAILIGCISSSYAQDFNDSIKSDLKTISIEISQDVQEGLSQALQNLESVESSEMTDLVGAPDYKPAFYNLQKHIQESLLRFTNDMNTLYLKIKKDLHRVKVIESTTFNSTYLNKQSQLEIQKAYENIGSYMDKDYKSALKNLYTLNGFIKNLPVKMKREGFKDIFKEYVKHQSSSLSELCSTSVCLSKISQDVSEWLKIADSMNNDIELSPKEKITFTNKANKVSNINHFSVAINDFTKSLIKIGLKPNKTYTTSQAAATYLAQIANSGAGVGVAIVMFPIKLINSAFRSIRSMDLTKKYLVKDLTLRGLDTFNINDAVEDLQMEAMRLKTKMIFTMGEEEYKNELVNSLDRHGSARSYIIDNVLPKDTEFKTTVEKYYPKYLETKSGNDESTTVDRRDASNAGNCDIRFSYLYDYGRGIHHKENSKYTRIVKKSLLNKGYSVSYGEHVKGKNYIGVRFGLWGNRGLFNDSLGFTELQIYIDGYGWLSRNNDSGTYEATGVTQRSSIKNAIDLLPACGELDVRRLGKATNYL